MMNMTVFNSLVAALQFIAEPGSKGQRRETARAALAEMFEGIETGKDVQFDAGYKKGYADAKEKIEALVKETLQSAEAGELSPEAVEPPATGSGVWATKIHVDVAKALTAKANEGMQKVDYLGIAYKLASSSPMNANITGIGIPPEAEDDDDDTPF